MTGPEFFLEALAEYEDALAYYETCERGLGDRFVDELDRAVATLMEFPAAAPVVPELAHRGLRWAILRSFPVKLVYTVRDDTFVVVAVFHARRRPGYWLERLQRLTTDKP